ncbi:transglutaminase [Tardibacter chloracetimidivorans]|uniref:Transglutaminase n=1 Tax=Tardibacter chloracetimidivorans TaxID=1921510 RepID=A0A1L3ZWI8_9SPHN|nr:transglutaminase family protein [Tardibacter chloracetimidivorans]API59994.1 transglutaminase [Tardibacter chloracetimidivorans]
MRIRIDHLTQYGYSLPVRSVIQILRLTPRSTAHQSVIDWRIEVDCDARLRPFTDAHGNLCHMMTVDHPVESLTIETIGQVDTTPGSGVVEGVSEPLPPAVYLRPTPLATADGAIADFARQAMGDATRDPLERLHTLLGAVHTGLRFDTGTTSILTDAASAFAARSGVCQDLAHVFIAAARSQGLPARYISGHLLRQDGAELQEAAHAWAEAHVPGLGWVAFDPANGICADEHYVRVAAGLDYRDAAPVAGARYGGGLETMSVGLHVRPGQAQSQSQS